MAENPIWNYANDHALLIACVGYDFGDNPLERLEDIREARGAYGQAVFQRMKMSADDVVLDIGSGCGFTARALAPRVKTIHCADISKDFLAFAARELSPFPNAHTHLIDYANFESLRDAGITKAYSTAVFIHFNIYDLLHYFRALAAIMPVGGKLYFDYNEALSIDPENHSGGVFMQHAQGYRWDRARIFNLLHPTTLAIVEKMGALAGWKTLESWQTFEATHSVLMERV